MGSKVFLVLVLFMAAIVLISTEVAPKDIDTDDGTFDRNEMEESKYVRRGGYHGYPRIGGPWRGGYRGHCRYGCCRWGYYGDCRRCCYYPGERTGAAVVAEFEPYN